MAKRQSGSVRFDPYWKVQWWDKTSLAWRDIQEAHQERDRAEHAARTECVARETNTRLMEVTEDGREPVLTCTYRGTFDPATGRTTP